MHENVEFLLYFEVFRGVFPIIFACNCWGFDQIQHIQVFAFDRLARSIRFQTQREFCLEFESVAQLPVAQLVVFIYE